MGKFLRSGTDQFAQSRSIAAVGKELAGGIGPPRQLDARCRKLRRHQPGLQLLQIELRGTDMSLFVATGDIEKFGNLSSKDEPGNVAPRTGTQGLTDMIAHHDEGFFAEIDPCS